MPEYGHMLRSMADDRVLFIPFVDSPPEVLGLVAQARLFVFPSTNSLGMEGMSMMLLEAASIGAPILASDFPQNVAVLGAQAFTSDLTLRKI